MDAVHQEVEGVDVLVVRNVSHPGVLSVEQEPVKMVLSETPKKNSGKDPHGNFATGHIGSFF